ncbi:MAG: hypothetical protein U0670_02195 [Anaerolineae bacterium]
MTDSLTRKQYLHDILRPVSPETDIQDLRLYTQAVAQPGHQGIVLQGARLGADRIETPQITVRAGYFMIAQYFPQKGLWGLVPPECDGALAAPGYHVFALSPAVDPDYFRGSLSTDFFASKVFKAARKTGRLFLRDFRRIPIWLPPLEEQSRIATVLHAGQESLEHSHSMIAAVQQIKRSVAADLFAQVNPSWESTTLGACATFLRTGRGTYPLIVTPSGAILRDQPLPVGAAAIQPTADLSADFLIEWLDYVLPGIANPSGALESLPLMLPTFYEQQKFVSVLRLHDEAIAALHEEYTALDHLLTQIREAIYSGGTLPPVLLEALAASIHPPTPPL